MCILHINYLYQHNDLYLHIDTTISLKYVCDKNRFYLAVVNLSLVILVSVFVVMVLVPPTMPPVVMMPITVVISIPIPITVSIPIAVRCTVAAPGSRTPRSAPGRNVAVGSVRGDAVMPIHVLHSAFHAANLALIVGSLVALPA